MKFELFQDASSEWRWRLIASNNADIVAVSGEGYKAKADALNGIRLVRATNDSTVIYERKTDGTWFKLLAPMPPDISPHGYEVMNMDTFSRRHGLNRSDANITVCDDARVARDRTNFEPAVLVLPQYEADDGPLTSAQVQQIKKPR